MENWLKRIFLSLLLSLLTVASIASYAAEVGTNEDEKDVISEVRIFDPQVERRKVKQDSIDKENWEFGLHYGLISIEDFGTREVLSLSLSYHVTEDLFLSLLYNQSEAGRTSAETLNGNLLILTDEERGYENYLVSLGYNVFSGEGFIGRDMAFTNNFYFLTGLGATDFAGDTASTVLIGGGYQLLFNDWLSMHISVKDFFYDIDVLGAEKTANDIQVTTGFTLFF